MKLITEHFEGLSLLTEAKEDGEKDYFIEGIFLQANKTNKNGRVYPMSVMESAVDRYIESHVNCGRAFGELGHPDGPQINLDRVSHMITSLRREGDNFIGKAKLVETIMGNTARGLIKSGGKVGVSSRGLGSLKANKQGIMEVQGDFKLATAADIVADPSAPDAFVKGIMENVDWVYDEVNDVWYQQKLHETKQELHRLTIEQIESRKLAIFESFMSNLRSKKTLV